MRGSKHEGGVDRDTNAVRRQVLTLDDQHEIDQVPDTAVRCSLARTGVRVRLLRPVLFGRQRGN